jgi:hypothetical protein
MRKCLYPETRMNANKSERWLINERYIIDQEHGRYHPKMEVTKKHGREEKKGYKKEKMM